MSTIFRSSVALVRRHAWVGVVLGVLFAAGWAKLLRPVPVVTAKVDRGTITEEAFGRGTIESQRQAALGFDLVGRVSEVLVDEGAHVVLGQELARLETNQAQADLRSAQTGVVAARASLQRLAAEEERARAQLAAADREVARSQALLDTGAIAPAQRDDATDRLRLARADLDRVLAQRSEATRGIDLAAGGAEQRRVTFVRATLLAPFEGLVTRRLREPGDTVTVGSTVLRIVDTSRVYVNASVDETVLPRLAVDQTSNIFFPGSDVSLPGRTSRVAWEADRQTHELFVEVTPHKLDRRVAIGQRADVRIEVARREGAIRVPSRMLRRDPAGTFVYVDRGGRVALVRPTLGVTGRDAVEVLAGLSDSDTLLAPPQAGGSLPVGRRWSAQ